MTGHHPLNLALNELRAPSELCLEGDVLVFMDENQGAVLWGIAGSGLALRIRRFYKPRQAPNSRGTPRTIPSRTSFS